VPLCRYLGPLRLIAGVALVVAAYAAYGSTVIPKFYAETSLSANCNERGTAAYNRREEKALADDDRSVGNTDDLSPGADLPPEGWISATITEIMESWPLQVRFATDTGEFIVELSIDAEIESATGKLSPGELSPGDQVKIFIEKVSGKIDTYHIAQVKKL
jgi:hypothetical protein